jgi:hypothetical protein
MKRKVRGSMCGKPSRAPMKPVDHNKTKSRGKMRELVVVMGW